MLVPATSTGVNRLINQINTVQVVYYNFLMVYILKQIPDT